MKLNAITVLIPILLLFILSPGAAHSGERPMTNNALDSLIRKIDPKATGEKGFWNLKYEQFQVQIITDSRADRMRIVLSIGSSTDIPRDKLYRMMQANFDSALDCRYAVARGILFSTFIHPLSPLTAREFFSGLAQTITLAATYGTSYSSGGLTFGGGDSNDLQKKYYDDIIKKGMI